MMQDPKENFNTCARHYAFNHGKSRTAVARQLLIKMYVWVLRQYAGSEANWIHRHLLSLSFLWDAFAKGIADWRRMNEKEKALPRLDKQGHRVCMRRLWDPEKIRQGIALGKTAINHLGDPLPKMNTIHAWFGQLYDEVQMQSITAGVPAHWNCDQQENKIIQYFAEMWDDKQYDVNCLPVSIDKPNNLFTAQELYISGAVALHQLETEEMDEDPEEVSTLMFRCVLRF